MHLAEAQKLGAFQAWNHAQHPLLLAEAHMILKAHQVVTARARVFLTELHHRIWPPAGSRIGQSHRLHRTEAQCFTPAPRDFFNRQARLEIARVILLDVRRHAPRFQHRIDKRFILLAVERTVQIIVRPIQRFPVA